MKKQSWTFLKDSNRKNYRAYRKNLQRGSTAFSLRAELAKQFESLMDYDRAGFIKVRGDKV